MTKNQSTLYRLGDDGEVHEVVAEETDEPPRVERTRVTMTAGLAAPKRAFNEITWWSRQLGRPLSTD